MQLSDFKLKHRMTVFQVTESRRILSKLLDLFERAKKAKSDDIMDEIAMKIVEETNARTDEQDQLMISSLSDCLELHEGQVNPLMNMEYLDMVDLFGQLYIASTQIEKKQSLQSTLQSSQEISNTQNIQTQ